MNASHLKTKVFFYSFFLILLFLSNYGFASADKYCKCNTGATTMISGEDCAPCIVFCKGQTDSNGYPGYQIDCSSTAPTGPTTGTVTLDNPLPDAGTPQALIGKVISAALGLVGSLALAMFIFGGFMWMTAMGNPEKVKKGRDTMVWAALGLVIIFTAYALITFVLTNVLGAK
ncbi:MAG: pilin [Patescibacteria group bacterium]|jgi:hypothetical protein